MFFIVYLLIFIIVLVVVCIVLYYCCGRDNRRRHHHHDGGGGEYYKSINMMNMNKDHNRHIAIPLSTTAYFINMDNAISRRQHTETLLMEIGFININRIIPIPSNEPWASASITHKSIIEKISKFEKEEFYFIFEDDVELANNMKDRSEVLDFINHELINVIDNDKLTLKFIYLGSCLTIEQNKTCTSNGCKCWCAHAYMLTPQAARDIIDRTKTLDWSMFYPDYVLQSQLSAQPLIGYQFKHDHTSPLWRGLFYQARRADWYSTGISA